MKLDNIFSSKKTERKEKVEIIWWALLWLSARPLVALFPQGKVSGYPPILQSHNTGQ